MEYRRKPVQVLRGHFAGGEAGVLCFCDDGSVWSRDTSGGNEEWTESVPIPGSTREEELRRSASEEAKE